MSGAPFTLRIRAEDYYRALLKVMGDARLDVSDVVLIDEDRQCP